ncbi:MAG: hypothetical protein HY736_11620 [Verrucomicrobia bacterium]|nr:hypothetical protein [Verrucomicrobiota bacterium]
MSGRSPHARDLFESRELYAGEWTTGIGIDPTSGTQDGERIYSAEYLRLRKNVSLGFSATLPMKHQGESNRVEERIGELFKRERTLVVGGQQRTCAVEPVNSGALLASVLPVGPKIAGTRVRWILLSPAVFPEIRSDEPRIIRAHPGGWLPNWIDPENGEILLRGGDISRRPNEGRSTWRERVRRESRIGGKLIAARVPKPVPITGWSERLHLANEDASLVAQLGLRADHGPRATHLAVPAGAVYYFACDSESAARALAGALNWHGESDGAQILRRRSTLLGEKGFGLGVCGTWKFLSETETAR